MEISVLAGVQKPDPLDMTQKTGSKQGKAEEVSHHLRALKALSKHAEVPEISSSRDTET